MRGAALILSIFALGFFLPAPVWAQTTLPPGSTESAYSAAQRSIAQAITNSVEANFTRRQIEEFKRVSTLEKIRAYLNQPANKLDSWIRVGQALGITGGIQLAPPGMKDSSYCKANPGTSLCIGGGAGDYGGGGSHVVGSWGGCDAVDYNMDAEGNLILPAMTLPDPVPYAFGRSMYLAESTSWTQTATPWSAIKVGLHLYNGTMNDSRQKVAPMYASQYCSGALCSYTVVASRAAYWNGTTRVSAFYRSSTTNINASAWQTNLTAYGSPPPPDYVCEDGIGMGQYNQVWKACIRPPSAWDIPQKGVLAPSALKAWAQGSDQSFCPISDELIRQLADLAYKKACADGTCEAPYSPIEKEDVRNGGQKPTIRDTANVETLPNKNAAADTPTTTPTPTPTPTTGPDYTDPGTTAPTTTSPEASSIIDAAFDWDFPSVEINIPTGTCPIYTADFFGHALTLDSHCPFIDTNRAIISAMMILMFTIASAFIVLRA